MENKVPKEISFTEEELQKEYPCPCLNCSYLRLLREVRALYYAAYWKSDRLTSETETKLWVNLRDAAGFTPGETAKVLGPNPRLPGATYEDYSGCTVLTVENK